MDGRKSSGKVCGGEMRRRRSRIRRRRRTEGERERREGRGEEKKASFVCYKKKGEESCP